MIELDWLKRWATYTPERIAIRDVDNQRSYSWAEFYRQSNRLARYLRDKYDIKRRDRVAVLGRNEVETVLLFFAVQRLGAILVPMNFRLAPPEIERVMADIDPSLLVYADDMQPVLEEIPPDVLPLNLMAMETAAGAQHDSLRSVVVDEDLSADPVAMQGVFEDTCMILHTSGTTGRFNGVMLTNRMLFWNSVNTSLRLSLNQYEQTLEFLPFFHTGGWNVLALPVMHRGGTVNYISKFDPERVLREADRLGVTVLFGVPTTMDMMARTKAFEEVALKSVRFAIVGGEAMSVPLIRKWQDKGIPIRQGYGLTEFGPNVFSLNEEDSIRKIGSIGFPNFYIDARIVDEDGRELEGEATGELTLRGPVCTPGYWRLGAETDELIRNDWLHTGDIVRRDTDGYYYVVDRKKDMYISGGENVYPAEVERVIRDITGIREVAVVGVADEKWGEVGKAFVVVDGDEKLTEDSIVDHCRRNLARYKVPAHVAFLKELPKSDSGKLLKRCLR